MRADPIAGPTYPPPPVPPAPVPPMPCPVPNPDEDAPGPPVSGQSPRFRVTGLGFTGHER
jgi:hypothetical protein